jgi:hypothetical protein
MLDLNTREYFLNLDLEALELFINNENNLNRNKLYDILLKIPKGRKIIYSEEMRDGKRIGKPRYKNSLYQWNSEMQTRLHDHLQDKIKVLLTRLTRDIHSGVKSLK